MKKTIPMYLTCVNNVGDDTDQKSVLMGNDVQFVVNLIILQRCVEAELFC